MIQLKSLQSTVCILPYASPRSLQFTLTGAKLNHVSVHMYFTSSLQFAPEGNENLAWFQVMISWCHNLSTSFDGKQLYFLQLVFHEKP